MLYRFLKYTNWFQIGWKMYLENVCFALAVAAGEHCVNGGRDAPHLCDASGRTRNPVSVQKPEVVPWRKTTWIQQHFKKDHQSNLKVYFIISVYFWSSDTSDLYFLCSCSRIIQIFYKQTFWVRNHKSKSWKMALENFSWCRKIDPDWVESYCWS